MRYRRFGRTGWRVSEVGYGMWGLAGWTGSDDEETRRALQRAVELGCNFFDTAYAYGEGKSEQMLGELGRQNAGVKLYTATKIPPKNRVWPSRREFSLDDCFPPDYMWEYVRLSLKNLGLDSIDLIQLHTWEDRWLEDDCLTTALTQMRDKGLVRAIGISLNRWEPWNGVKAVQSGLVDAVQVIYNIFDQNPEDELFPACQDMDVAVIARVPFDEGSLTGTLTTQSSWPADDWRSTYFVPENLHATLERVEKLKPLVPPGMTLPDMAMRFVLSNPIVSTVIPGMRKVKHVEANIAVSDGKGLTPDLLAELRQHRWVRHPTPWSQ
jgi:aryl-alcohol dehydrogenase-like predicted oxidoreductase